MGGKERESPKGLYTLGIGGWVRSNAYSRAMDRWDCKNQNVRTMATLLTGLDDRLKLDDSQGDTNESENNCFLVFNIF